MALDIRAVFPLSELASRMHNTKLIAIVEALSQKLTLVDDLLWKPATDTWSHTTTRRIYEPQGSERIINLGATVTSSQTQKYTEYMCVIEDWSEIDELIVEASKDPRRFRAGEDLAHLNGLRKRLSQRFFYGDRSDGKQINGITLRSDYNNTTSGYVYDNSGGNSSVNQTKSSIYIVCHGGDALHMVHGPDGQIGIKQEDKRKVTLIEGATNNQRRDVYRTKFNLKFGLVIRDPRAVRRICNISMEANPDGINEFPINEDYLIDAVNDLLAFNGAEGAIIYCHPQVSAQLWKRGKDKGNVWWNTNTPFGKPLMQLWNIPIHLDEQILVTEAQVTA